MIQDNNPNIDVDELMARVRSEVLHFGEPAASPQTDRSVRTFIYESELDTTSIESLLHTAERMAQPRTKWSGRLSSFPFNARWFQRFGLKLLAFVFNDQRHVNFALIQAVREMLDMNRELHRVMVAQQSSLRRLEGRLRLIEEPDAE